MEIVRQIDLAILEAFNALAWKSLALDRCVVKPGLFYCAAFILTWQIADLFGGTRALLGTVGRAATNT